MNLSDKRILIVDDDDKFRMLVRKILETQGATVEEAPNLQITYSLLEKNYPDLIILDLQLSATESGSDFLKLRRNNNALKQIPTIVCSAEGQTKVVKKIIDIGVEDYIVKPIRQDKLLIKVKKCLKSKDFLEYKFTEIEQLDKINLTTWGELVSLGEASCKLRTPMKFSQAENIKIFLTALKDKIEPNKDCRTNKASKPSQAGVYDTFCNMMGISETEANKIRTLKSSWRNIK